MMMIASTHLVEILPPMPMVWPSPEDVSPSSSTTEWSTAECLAPGVDQTVAEHRLATRSVGCTRRWWVLDPDLHQRTSLGQLDGGVPSAVRLIDAIDRGHAGAHSIGCIFGCSQGGSAAAEADSPGKQGGAGRRSYRVQRD
jgi:hypothetical protein